MNLFSFNPTTLANINSFVPGGVGAYDAGNGVCIVQHTDNTIYVGMATNVGTPFDINIATANQDYTVVSLATVIQPAVVGGIEGLALVQANTPTAGFTGVWLLWGEADTTAPAISGITNFAGVAGNASHLHWRGVSSVPAAVGPLRTNSHAALASRGFTIPATGAGTRACVLIAYRYTGATTSGTIALASTSQPCYYLATIPQDEQGSATANDLHLFGRIDQDHATFGAGNTPTHLPGVSSITTTRIVPYITRNIVPVRATGTDMGGIGYATLDFLPRSRLLVKERNNAAYISGGMLYYFDGSIGRENSINVFPERPYFENQGGGAGVDVGDHEYTIVRVYVDGNGNTHRTAPSPPLAMNVAGAAAAIDIYFPEIVPFSQRNGRGGAPFMAAEIYRTSLTDGLFHLAVRGVPAASAVGGFVFLQDTTTNANLNNRPLLYTTSGERPNFPPPAPRGLTFSKDRCWLSRGNELWFSKPLKPLLAAEFTQAQVFEISEGVGPITAIEVLDEKVIIFKANSIFVISGEGPDEALQGDGFSPPVRVSSDIGSINAGSVVKTSIGLMFQSSRGVYLLDRGLQTSFIGAPIQGLLTTEVINRALVVPDKGQVRFLCRALEQVFVYDLLTEQWTTFDNYDNGIDCTLDSSNRFRWFSTDGLGRIERLDADTARYQDILADGNPRFQPLEIITPWIKLSGLQGYGRIKKILLLGDRLGAFNFRVQARYDYETAFTTTWTLTNANIVAIRYRTGDAAITRFQLQLNIPRQKCQAISFRFIDEVPEPVSYSGGYTLLGLDVVYAVKKASIPLTSGAVR